MIDLIQSQLLECLSIAAKRHLTIKNGHCQRFVRFFYDDKTIFNRLCRLFYRPIYHRLSHRPLCGQGDFLGVRFRLLRL